MVIDYKADYLELTQASLFLLSCLIFIYLYFLLAKPADTNFNLLVNDEEDYQVDVDEDDDGEENCQDDCNGGGDDLKEKIFHNDDSGVVGKKIKEK